MTMSQAWLRRTWLIMLVAAVLVGTTLAYARGLNGPFLMDDFDAIFPLAASEASQTGLIEVLRTAPAHIRMRWVSNLTFVATQELTGSPVPPAAFAYKLGNLLIHLLTAGVLAALAALCLRRFGGGRTGQVGPAAVLAAGIFLAHPLLASTVLYPVQRMAQLSALFCLLAVMMYIRWRERLPSSTGTENVLRMLSVLFATGLAVFSKENGALAVLLIGVVELTLFQWPPKNARFRGRFEAGFGLMCAGPLVLGIVLFATRWQQLVAGYELRSFTLEERLLTQVHVLWYYIGQIFWPRVGALGLYQDAFPVTESLDAGTLLLGGSLTIAAVLAIVLRRKLPAIALAVLWFLAAHSMESTIIPLEMVFEHRNYLALPGICIAIAWLATRIPTRWMLLASTAVLGLLLSQLHIRALQWSSYETWIRTEASNHPNSLRAAGDLFSYLLAIGAEREAERALDDIALRFPQRAQPELFELLANCSSPVAAPSSLPPAFPRLATASIEKDLFHVYTRLVELKTSGSCPGVDWGMLATATGAIVSNPRLRDDSKAQAAWSREHARALAAEGNWQAAERAILRAIDAQPNHPPDWVFLMRARLELGSAGGYMQARAKLMSLLNGQLGWLEPEFEELEAAARTRFSGIRM